MLAVIKFNPKPPALVDIKKSVIDQADQDLDTQFPDDSPALKKQLKDLNVGLKTRANKSGCLGICDFGPTIAIYPEGVFYVGVKKEDVTEILQSHIINKKPVERLLLKEWK